MPDSTETRTYEVITSSQTFRITVPAAARVSYAPVISAAGKSAYGGNALRVWLGTKATEVQLALFNNVISFRDVSMTILVRAVRKYGTEEWIEDDGSWTGEKAALVESGWINPDEIKNITIPTTEPDEVEDLSAWASTVPKWPSRTIAAKTPSTAIKHDWTKET